MLPRDLREAEDQALAALQRALADQPRGRWSIEWRFEGLRLLPVVLRLHRSLIGSLPHTRLIFPDAGAAALARRDAPDQAASISDLRAEQRRLEEQGRFAEQGQPGSEGSLRDAVLLGVAPSQADYGDFEQLCLAHRGAVVLINGSLEDAAVGIGSVARERRRGFLAQWRVAYALQPLEGAALRRCHPDDWELYRQDADGFRLAGRFPQRPDAEQQAAALDGAAGLAGNLKAMDAFLEGLRR